MERLQVAIEKARTSRERATAEKAGLSPQTPETNPADAWDALRPIALDPAHLTSKRIITHIKDSAATSFDLLRTRILQQTRQHGWRRIAMVSADTGAGKTTTVANLAFCLGRQDDIKSLVLDLDLRRPGLAQVLGQKCHSNMAEVIGGALSFADHGMRYGDNLAFGLNNMPASNPSELLQSHRMTDLLTALDEIYAPDITLFDIPPLLATDDSYGFLRNVDCALIIVEAERTPISQVDVIERQVAEITNVLGVVLNRCNYANGLNGADYGYS
ncbi:CpsD/CapB family tyrosine-protein kinase [Actibacterium sp. D379-3]